MTWSILIHSIFGNGGWNINSQQFMIGIFGFSFNNIFVWHIYIVFFNAEKGGIKNWPNIDMLNILPSCIILHIFSEMCICLRSHKAWAMKKRQTKIVDQTLFKQKRALFRFFSPFFLFHCWFALESLAWN